MRYLLILIYVVMIVVVVKSILKLRDESRNGGPL